MDTVCLRDTTSADILIVITALGSVAFWFYHRRASEGLEGRHLPPALLSGLLLMLALRMHTVASAWMPVAALLAGAGVLHTPGLRRCWWRTGHQRAAIKQLS
jgi:hypothetical protein